MSNDENGGKDLADGLALVGIGTEKLKRQGALVVVFIIAGAISAAVWAVTAYNTITFQLATITANQTEQKELQKQNDAKYGELPFRMGAVERDQSTMREQIKDILQRLK